jgi:hypothetical protein
MVMQFLPTSLPMIFLVEWAGRLHEIQEAQTIANVPSYVTVHMTLHLFAASNCCRSLAAQ